MTASRDTCHQSEMNCTEHEVDRLALDLNGSNSMLDKTIGMGRETHNVAIGTLASDSFQVDSGVVKAVLEIKLEFSL